jgi:hypothetical protein
VKFERATKIKRQREESLQAMEKQAKKKKKMKIISNKNVLAALIRQTERVNIPDFDQCKTDCRTLLTVVIEIIDGEFYRLDSNDGILNELFTRNQFTSCEKKSIPISGSKYNNKHTLGIIFALRRVRIFEV